jgi:hypothetical protein
MNSVKLLRVLTYASVSALLLLVVLVYRRFKPSSLDVPYACHAASVLALSLGIPTILSGLVHSAAVASLALNGAEPYGPLTILRFTTGAMLFYSGAMSIALYRAIRVGRAWAIGISMATCLFFCLYLLFLFPLPGTGGTVPPMLGLWSVYLPVLVAAALSTGPRVDTVHTGTAPQ